MSGVIDRNGVQWERCTAHETPHLVEFPRKAFDIVPSPQYPNGGTICLDCVHRLQRNGVPFEHIAPYVPEQWSIGTIDA